MDHWYVVLTATQQEVPIVWRLHLLGLEMFTPVLRRRVRTGRVHKGRAITRLVVRPMFPSYGFVRQGEGRDVSAVLGVRGVRGLLRNERGDIATLPHQAILAIYATQQQELEEFTALQRRGRHFATNLKAGQQVRVDDGGVYSGMVAAVDRIDARGRVEVLFGMIRHTMPIDMVKAS